MAKNRAISEMVREVLEAQPHLRGDHWRLYWEVVARMQEVPQSVRDFVLRPDLPNYESVRRASRPSGRA